MLPGRRRCDTIGDFGDHGQAVRRALVGNRHGHGLARGRRADGQADPRHGGERDRGLLQSYLGRFGGGMAVAGGQ